MTSNPESIRLELKAVSILCDYWAGTGFGRKQPSELAQKIPHFRDAVIAGQGSGSPEDVPFEFLADDYDVVYYAVQNLDTRWLTEACGKTISTWLETVTVPYKLCRGKKCLTVNLPVPCPAKAVELLSSRFTKGKNRDTPSVVAAKIVSKRLSSNDTGVKWETVRKAPRLRKKERARVKFRQNLSLLLFEKRLLISVFFDLSSTTPDRKTLHWRAKILDALMADYPLIGIYYLVKVSTELAGRTYLCDYNFREVGKLYRLAYPKAVTGPFSRLVSSHFGQASQGNAKRDPS